jgi:hypothetical protein
MKYKLQFWFSYNTTDKLFAEIVLLLLNDTVYRLLQSLSCLIHAYKMWWSLRYLLLLLFLDF